MNTSEQIVNGLMRYTDREIIPKMGTAGKWIIGTAAGMIGKRAGTIANGLQTNSIAKMIGAVNDDGLFDIDLIAEHMRNAADKYGNMQIELPMMGTMTFTSDDVEKAKRYIKGEM